MRYLTRLTLIPGFVMERLWRSLKQEEVCRHAYETVAEAGIADYPRYFSEERPHQGLTTEPPTTYSTNESRYPKRHSPTRQYT